MAVLAIADATVIETSTATGAAIPTGSTNASSGTAISASRSRMRT